ncbi:uncharacterized protein CG1161 isoform X1 [Anthonomus grandis grandis]|uniref:uncharacterized protein CG1161 isoform X1 n=1 Tax=Anthonomus grandis grandis TaxID=2921223 RepID=UPI00216625BE|nr:uncharacterized protein CG1161 isoform X1 [Anthonomus grandis grandis]
MKYLLIVGLFIWPLYTNSQAQSFDDKRCKCICPSLSSVTNKTDKSHTETLMQTTNDPPNKCTCEVVMLPKVADKLNVTEMREFCPRCACKYENRNTTIIRHVVIFVIWVISILVVYMLFLIILDPLLNKKAKGNYQEHTNEEEDIHPGVSHNMSIRGNVLNRVSNQQDKWKRQVKEQRKNIYDRHTMLN